ncbi:hypothetical protein Tco_0302709 [Tanacetum coccineum]
MTDSSQRPPRDCVKCGNPIESPSCQGCALWRKKLKEVWFRICHGNGIYQDLLNTFESSDDNTNVVNAPQEPFVVKHDPDENSSQSPPQINHNCAHIGYNYPSKALIISNLEPCNQTIDELPQTLPSFDPTCCFEKENSLPYVSKPNFVDDSPNVFNPPPQPPMYSCEFCGNDARYGYYCTPQKEEEKRIEEEQAAKARYWKIPVCYDDDDDEESSIPLKDIIVSGLPPVENLVPTPSESEDASDGVCDLPICDDFPKSHLVSFSNPLFNINDDCTSSDDESFSEEDVLMENFKFFSNHLFDLDEEIVSTEINSLLDEFAGELTLLKSIPPGIDDDNLDPEGEIHPVERLLYDNSSPRPLEDSNSDVSDAILNLSLCIETDDYNSEGDILFFEELLTDDSFSLPENESFHFESDYDPSSPRPLTKPPDDDEIEPDTGLLTTKVDFSDFEASRARGFVLRSQELHILSFIWEIQYPNLID